MKTMINDGGSNQKPPLSTSIIRVLLGVAALLSVPLIAMQFTNEVDWDGRDFMIMGILLSSTGMMFVLASRKVRDPLYRNLAFLAIAGACFLLWAEMAVGVFGSPIAGS
jgi:hypothetical protein